MVSGHIQKTNSRGSPGRRHFPGPWCAHPSCTQERGPLPGLQPRQQPGGTEGGQDSSEKGQKERPELLPQLAHQVLCGAHQGDKGQRQPAQPPTGGCAVAGRGSPTIHAQCEQELVSPPPPPPTSGSVCVTQHLTDSPRGSGWERRENKQLQLPRGGWRRKANTTAPPTSKILRG